MLSMMMCCCCCCDPGRRRSFWANRKSRPSRTKGQQIDVIILSYVKLNREHLFVLDIHFIGKGKHKSLEIWVLYRHLCELCEFSKNVRPVKSLQSIQVLLNYYTELVVQNILNRWMWVQTCCVTQWCPYAGSGWTQRTARPGRELWTWRRHGTRRD